MMMAAIDGDRAGSGAAFDHAIGLVTPGRGKMPGTETGIND
jgi:hypothetical protein